MGLICLINTLLNALFTCRICLASSKSLFQMCNENQLWLQLHLYLLHFYSFSYRHGNSRNYSQIQLWICCYYDQMLTRLLRWIVAACEKIMPIKYVTICYLNQSLQPQWIHIIVAPGIELRIQIIFGERQHRGFPPLHSLFWDFHFASIDPPPQHSHSCCCIHGKWILSGSLMWEPTYISGPTRRNRPEYTIHWYIFTPKQRRQTVFIVFNSMNTGGYRSGMNNRRKK